MRTPGLERGLTPARVSRYDSLQTMATCRAIGDFGGRVFHAKQGGDLTRMDSVQGFKQLFEPGDVMEAAYKEA